MRKCFKLTSFKKSCGMVDYLESGLVKMASMSKEYKENRNKQINFYVHILVSFLSVCELT